MDERILQQIAGALDLWYPSRAIPGCRLGSMCPEKFLAQQGPAAVDPQEPPPDIQTCLPSTATARGRSFEVAVA
jgi:hypothetical protein